MPSAPSYPLGAYPDLEPFFEALRRDMQLRRSTQRVPYASSITPNANKGEIVVVDVLTGDLTVANPVNARDGMRLYFSFTQDATGGRTVTFGSDFSTSWGTIEDANATSTVDFWYDGTAGKWVQGSDNITAPSGGGGGLPSVITQLITFDRDPSPPFAVTAGSGVVTSLDSDLLDGQHGSYYRDAGNLNAGTLLDARVAESNVTQHEAALTILETQITDGSLLARVAETETITGLWSFSHASGLKTDTIVERTAAAGVTVDGLLIKDGGIPEAAVTAHEAALTILESQITDGTILARVAASETITGTYAFNPAAGAPFTTTRTDLVINLNADLLDGSHASAFASASGLSTHIADTGNPHSVTKSQVGLTNVEDTALSTWAGSSNLTTLGTLATGAVPASLVTAGSFGTGAYVFDSTVTVNQLKPTSLLGKFGTHLDLFCASGKSFRVINNAASNTLLEVTDAGNILVGRDMDLQSNDLLNATLRFVEHSSDPPTPAEGTSVMWQSDGTGSGDDGDVLLKIKAGGITKTVSFVGFSALPDRIFSGALELEETETITGGVTDGYAAALRLDPGYTAASALTVTRHNYIDIQDVLLSGAGPAALTDACVFRFDAAAGTHKALTTEAVKINVDGALQYMPFYPAAGPLVLPVGLRLPTVTKTANYTATGADFGIKCNASGTPFAITLPAVSGVDGLILHVKKIDSSANAVTLAPDGSDTIDGDPDVDIVDKDESYMIQANAAASNWDVL